jgi:hypothetical protein
MASPTPAGRTRAPKSDAENYIALSHREHSDSWTMDKDGKKYWGTAPGSKHMGQ